MATGGRFIELGKREIWSAQQVQAQRPDVGYFAFDLDEVTAATPTLIVQLLAQVMAAFHARTLQPLPHQIFAMPQVGQAFRQMQQARHVGKLVITQPQFEGQAPVAIQPDGSYLITGGLGALGLKVANWLVTQGVRHLVLAGRRGIATPVAQAAVTQFEQAGVQVCVLNADVTQPADVARLIAACQTLGPLRGVVHAAGVLADGVLTQQTWARFVQVMGPKITGAWNLHLATQHWPLDFFIAFSSDAALLGAAGQGNYAAANAFLDALAHHRRALGLPALTVNWGAWGDGGMTTALTANQQNRLATLGIKYMAAELNLQLLAELTGQSSPQVGVMAMEWSKWLQQFQEKPRFLAQFASEQKTTHVELSLLQQLAAAPINQRRALLVEHVRATVGRVLGPATAATLDLHQGFFAAGMDSLTSIELRNLLQTAFSCKLPLTLAFTYSTLASLVNYLATEVLAIEFSVKAPSEITVQPSLRTAIEELSEAEAEALLLSELSNLQSS